MLEYLNQTTNAHMITIEDPIEFIFKLRSIAEEDGVIAHAGGKFDIAIFGYKYFLNPVVPKGVATEG